MELLIVYLLALMLNHELELIIFNLNNVIQIQNQKN